MIAWDLLEKTLGGKCSSNSRIISRRHSLKCMRSSPCCELVCSDLWPRYETLTVETVSTHAMLYTWHGSMEGLKPLFFMGHSDVSTQDIPRAAPVTIPGCSRWHLDYGRMVLPSLFGPLRWGIHLGTRIGGRQIQPYCDAHCH
jgi:hypothetical protein